MLTNSKAAPISANFGTLPAIAAMATDPEINLLTRRPGEPP